MKNLKRASLFLMVITALTFTSCNDVEPVDPDLLNNPTNPTNPNNPDPTAPGVFKVSIDGITYTGTSTTVYISGGSIQIGATRSQGDSFGFLLDGTTVGSYPAHQNIVAYSPANSEYGYWAINPDDMNAPTGTVTITNIDTVNKKISGTFNFTGYWSDTDATGIAPKSFTNGIFTNLSYVTDDPNNGLFFAKVNGVDFNQNDLLVMTMGAGTDEFIAIGASNGLGNEMTVAVRSSVGLGTHPITGNSGDNAQINYSLDGGTSAQATSGSVTVQEKTDTHIKGVFSGTVVLEGVTYSITTGSFDVEY